ncbi:acetate--CoA ligase family protein [Candidatus Bipolaricaulota bacterium]|nr:acetate--CoA ligase family protein [Candidatus Bipolaricaulota bacterium]
MKTVECQGKDLLGAYGVPVPDRKVVTSKSLLGLCAEDCSQFPLPGMVKAQVPFGGRGKAGGITEADTPSELLSRASEMIGSDLKGTEVRSVLVEKRAEILDEIYLAVTFDAGSRAPLLMAGKEGGVDVESSARLRGEGFHTARIDTALGVPPYLKRLFAKKLGIVDAAAFGDLVESVYTMYRKKDALLVEINPLAVTPDGLMALDAKVDLDDGAEFRHRELFERLREEQKHLIEGEKGEPQRLAKEYGVDYVPLDGDVGVISDGAGTGMLTLDVITEGGGAPADFCEMGGEADARTVARSMEVVLANPDVSVLLITLIGGLTRMDHMAEGIANYLEENEVGPPLVIRMCGTKEVEGKRILEGLGIDTYDDHSEAVGRAVELSRGG